MDRWAAQNGIANRSAVLDAGLKALREKDLEEQYLLADEEWYSSGDTALWDNTVADGLFQYK